MIDMMTRKPIAVKTDGGAGPYLDVVLDQLDKVVALFDANAIPHWVEEEALSMDGGPAVITVNLADRADPILAQRVLDSIP